MIQIRIFYYITDTKLPNMQKRKGKFSSNRELFRSNKKINNFEKNTK
jgi:hypothetical protein